MLGYLFFLHPNMTDHVSLKGTISEVLNAVTISKEEVKEVDPNDTTYFHFTEDDNEDKNIAEADDKDAENNRDDTELLNIPFEFSTLALDMALE